MTPEAQAPENEGSQLSPAADASADTRLVVTSDQFDLSTARQITSEYLRDGCDWVDQDAVLLVVSEMLSNAVLHGGGWWRLVVVGSARQLRIEVQDKECVVPFLRPADVKGSLGGLGMHIISKLVTSYETAVDPAGDGKTVRAVWNRSVLPGSRMGI